MRSVIAKILPDAHIAAEESRSAECVAADGAGEVRAGLKVRSALKHGEVTQLATLEKFLRVKAAVGCNRIVEPARLFPASAPASPPSIMLNGKPVRQKIVPEICHPPIAAFIRRFSLLNGN